MSSKRFKKLPEKTSTLPSKSLDIFLSEVKKNCTNKFDESIDLSFQINIKQKKMKLTLGLLLIFQVDQVKKLKLL